MQQALHDLEVQKIELEMQNEELRRTLLELDSTRASFFDFYDLAPVGYCTLSAQGLIWTANLTTARLLGCERQSLVGKRFTAFIEPRDQDSFYRMRQQVLGSTETQSCELPLRRSDDQVSWVFLQAMATTDATGQQTLRLVLSDISAKRQREEQMHLQALVLDQIQDQVTITDLNGTVTYLNQAGRERRDKNGAELLGQHVNAYGDSEQADASQAEITEATLTQGGWHGKVINFQSDGSTRNYDLRTSLVKDASGTPIAMVGISADITDKLKLEQDLYQREEQIRLQALALDQIQDRVTITDVNGVVTYLNQAGRQNIELAADEQQLGQHVSDYGDSQFADAQHDEIIHTTLTQGAWQGQVGHVRANGSEVFYSLRTSLVKDKSGAPIAMVGVGTDITHQLALENELRQREQYLRALLDNFPFEVWLKDTDGRYLAVNQTMATARGWPSTQSLVGKRFEDIADPASAAKALEQEQEVMASGASQLMEIVLQHEDGARWFETYKAPISVDGQLVGTVGFARDISERKEIEIELEEARNEAVKANLAKSHFLAAASHDLRQPIFALSLFFGSLKNRVPPQHGELLDKIESCIESLSEMLSDLLDVSKLEAGIIRPNITNFSVDDMLHKLLSTHGARAYSAGLRLRSHDSGLVGRSDPMLLSRIVGNLLDNAIRHTRKGGVLIACRRHGGRHWIEIWDTGIGIAQDKLSIIFEAFHRLDDAARIQGSGLGLAIAQKTSALLGLQIRVSSRPGRGSMFAIELPLGEGVTPAQRIGMRPVSRRLRIGLVEDDKRVLDALLLALEDAGHDLIAATSGKALIEALGRRAPDIIVSDYRLADTETGYDVIETSRKIFGKDLPALLITGDTDPALVLSMSKRGIKVLYKPLQFDALQTYIRDAVDAVYAAKP